MDATRTRAPWTLTGWRKVKLIQECARSGKTNGRLARDYGVAEQTIANFKVTHRDEIQEEIDALAEDYDRIWFAQQQNRVMFLAGLIEDYENRKEVLQAEAERATIQMRAIDPDAAEVSVPVKEWDQLCKSQAGYAKQLAEELGQLKQRAPSSEQSAALRVVHEIGVDMSRAFPAKEPA
jgi:transposase-like protein